MRHVVRILAPYLRRYRKALALGLGALLLRNIAASCTPLIIRGSCGFHDTWFHDDGRGLVAGVLIVVTILKGTFQFGMRVILIGVSRDTEYDYRNDLFAHLVRMSPDFYYRYRTGDLMSRVTNDLSSVRGMLGPGIMYTADTIATAIFAVGIMIWADWRLTLAALLPAPAVTVVVVVIGRRIHRRFQKIQAIVFGYQQPGPGKCYGRASNSRVRPGGSGTTRLRGAK